MQFFEDENGNLRPVSEINMIRGEPQKAAPFKPPISGYTVYLRDGSTCTIPAWEKARLDRLPAKMLPAAPETYMLSAPGELGGDCSDPWRTPIIAWAITSAGDVDAYTADGRNDGLTEPRPILFPNGMVVEQHNQSWRSEADWLRDVRQQQLGKSAEA